MDIKVGQVWESVNNKSVKCVILAKDSHEVFYQKTDREHQTVANIKDFLRQYKPIDIQSEEYEGLFVPEIYSSKEDKEEQNQTICDAAENIHNAFVKIGESAAKAYEGSMQKVHKADMVNNPPHYQNASGIECKDITCRKDMSFSLGNAIKYLYRAGDKGDTLEDLKKAKWYIRQAWFNSEVFPADAERRLNGVAIHKQKDIGNVLRCIAQNKLIYAHQDLDKAIAKLEGNDER